MSLNRAQWVEMWEAISRIEERISYRSISDFSMITDIAKIKKLIQEVIGQME